MSVELLGFDVTADAVFSAVTFVALKDVIVVEGRTSTVIVVLPKQHRDWASHV